MVTEPLVDVSFYIIQDKKDKETLGSKRPCPFQQTNSSHKKIFKNSIIHQEVVFCVLDRYMPRLLKKKIVCTADACVVVLSFRSISNKGK